MTMIIKGRVWKFGDNLQGDYHLIPYPKIREIFDPQELARYSMLNVDPQFSKKAKRGDIIVAGENFACDICHPHALMAFRGLGIALIIAESIAGEVIIDHALHEGLPMMECKGIVRFFDTGDQMEADLESGLIKNISTGKAPNTKPMPQVFLERLKAGGLVPYLRQKIGAV